MPILICFVGHSHIPGIYGLNGQLAHVMEDPVSLDAENRYIINVGSLGQPRDSDPRMAFALFDSENYTVEIIRLKYDVETASRKILDNGLPSYLASRIQIGR